MQTQRGKSTRLSAAQSAPPFWLRLLRHNIPIVSFILIATISMVAIYWYFNPEGNDAEAISAIVAGNTLSAPLFKEVPAKPVLQRLAQSPQPTQIGIIAGHKAFDSGAVCEDGLTEASVNADLAERLAANLQARGIRAEVLEEFDARLTGYSATALISIHADSCEYVNDLASGFKIAGSTYTDSSQLSICVEQAYSAATGLAYHSNTITADMTNYHAFGEIASGTPAIIIEVGFMYLDRELLTTNTDPVIIGLINGVTCFLEAGG